MRAAAVLLALAIPTGCAFWATADDRPDVSNVPMSSCGSCHATTRATAPWDVMATYPDFPPGALVQDKADNNGLAEGFGDLLPLESSLLEFNTWKSIIADSDKGQDKTCFSCHLQEAKRVDGPKLANPELANLHAWLDTPKKDALSSSMGLWVDVDTFKTMVVATVKVLNYGGGHRVPTGNDGRNIALIVRGVDAKGNALESIRGPIFPKIVGAPLAETPGFLYARLWADSDGKIGVPVESAARVASDSRLQAGEHDELHFTFLLPETAPDSGVAWTIEAKLVWRSALSGKVEEAQMEVASANSGG